MDESELPGEVERILDADVEALATGRAVDVRCIATEKDRSFPIGRDNAPLYIEGRRPKKRLDVEGKAGSFSGDFFPIWNGESGLLTSSGHGSEETELVFFWQGDNAKDPLWADK